MRKYSGILVCSDFDGTLFCNNRISPANAEAIKYFQENGGLFTVASGRYPSFIESYHEVFRPNTFVIALNGSLIYDIASGKAVFEGFMTGDLCSLIKQIICEVDGISDIGVFNRDDYKQFNSSECNSKVFISALNKPVYKLLLHIPHKTSEISANIIASIAGDKYCAVRSWIGGVEIQDAMFSKGRTARRLARILGAEKLVCIGNYENDISMIEEADIGYAVGDSLPQLIAVADRVTVNAEENAIAKMLSEL